MNQFPRSQDIFIENEHKSIIYHFISQVYGWMTCGLLLTTFVAWYTTRSPIILHYIFSNPLYIISLILFQFFLVFMISNALNKLTGFMATTLFMLYSALTGLTISSIFILYTTSSIVSTFIVTSGMFGFMSVYGYTTKQDLTKYHSFFVMCVIGLLLSSVLNFLLNNEATLWITTYIGVFVFVGLTAYDIQKIKNIGFSSLIYSDDPVTPDAFRKLSIIGALNLYLDFINLFIMLLRLVGNRK